MRWNVGDNQERGDRFLANLQASAKIGGGVAA